MVVTAQLVDYQLWTPLLLRVPASYIFLETIMFLTKI